MALEPYLIHSCRPRPYPFHIRAVDRSFAARPFPGAALEKNVLVDAAALRALVG